MLRSSARHIAKAAGIDEMTVRRRAAMFIQDHFGAGGSFCELYLLDFQGGFVVAGHDGLESTTGGLNHCAVQPSEDARGAVGVTPGGLRVGAQNDCPHPVMLDVLTWRVKPRVPQ